jgi:hypothetical protein
MIRRDLFANLSSSIRSQQQERRRHAFFAHHPCASTRIAPGSASAAVFSIPFRAIFTSRSPEACIASAGFSRPTSSKASDGLSKPDQTTSARPSGNFCIPSGRAPIQFPLFSVALQSSFVALELSDYRLENSPEPIYPAPMRSWGKLIFIQMGLLVALWPQSQLDAATMTFPAVADTAMFESNPDYNLGGTTMVSGTNQRYSRTRALFRFSLAMLPTGAQITSADVILNVTTRPDPDQHGGPVNSDFSLHRLYVSWGEGTGSNATGSVADIGSATWNQRHFGESSWANPGGLRGTDYAETPSATTFVAGVGEYVWGTSAGLVDDVIAWQANPTENFGYILVSQDEVSLGTGRRFATKEQPGGTALPAQLRVTYTLVPEPSVAGLFLAGFVTLTFRRKRRD